LSGSSGQDEVDQFFIKLNPKDASLHSSRIREYALAYFNKGNFGSYNMIFSRYIKGMRDLIDSEMHDFLIKYLISSIIKKNYDVAITDINIIKQNYTKYDMNIYIL
jgi:hypothetical protein